MSRSNDPGHYFQTTEALATTERKAAKSKNKYGDPIKLSSKVLAVIADPFTENSVFLAEAVGQISRVDLEVCKQTLVTRYRTPRSHRPRVEKSRRSSIRVQLH